MYSFISIYTDHHLWWRYKSLFRRLERLVQVIRNTRMTLKILLCCLGCLIFLCKLHVTCHVWVLTECCSLHVSFAFSVYFLNIIYHVIHPERLFPDFFWSINLFRSNTDQHEKGAPLKDWYMILMSVVMVMMMMKTCYLIQLLIKLPHQIHALGIICIQKMLYLKRNALYLATSWLIFWKHWMDLV